MFSQAVSKAVGIIGLGIVLMSGAQAQSLEALSMRLVELEPGKAQWMSPRELAEISKRTHQNGHCGGYVDVTESQLFGIATPNRVASFLAGYQIKHVDAVKKILPDIQASRIFDTVRHLSSYPTRYYTTDSAAEAAAWIVTEMKAVAKSRSDIVVETIQHKSRNPFQKWKMPSVRARIPGTGPLKDEIVIVGGHIDSTSSQNLTNAPGADDDASGTATFMEAFRVLVQSGFRPNRTVEFIGYAAEEAGLLGSQAIAADYKAAGKKVAGVLQMDMTMFPGGGNVITFMSDYVDAELTQFTAKLVDQYLSIPWAMGKCGYGCSDHASWTKAGYASVFPFEANFGKHNKAIHTPKDTIDLLSTEFGVEFAKLSVAFAMELGLN